MGYQPGWRSMIKNEENWTERRTQRRSSIRNLRRIRREFQRKIVCHNIKNETAGRSLEQLKDDIDKEIGTESDPLVQWDQLICKIEEAIANKKSNLMVISEEISPRNKDLQTGGREHHWLAAAADEQRKRTATNS